MHNGVYIHPRDLRADAACGGVSGLAAMGFADAALAASYHAGRWLVPSGDGALVEFLKDGVVHFTPRDGYGVLQPLPSFDPAAAPSPLASFCAAAGAAGLSTYAWTVLFHNSRLGRRHRQSCIRNAWGDRYEYALCPARAEVRDYAVALVGDLGRHRGLGTVELEAAGYFGHRHGSHHDKSSFVADGYRDFLLSYCFCEACVAGLDQRGVDGAELQSRVAGLLRAEFHAGDAMQPPAASDPAPRLAEALGVTSLGAMLDHRREVHRATLTALRAALPPGVRMALHLRFDPLTTGSQMGQRLDDVGDLVDEVLVTHYGEDPQRIAASWRGCAVGERVVRLAIWPKAPQFCSDDDLRRVVDVAGDSGCAGIRVYHAGLLPRRTLQRVAAVLNRPG